MIELMAAASGGGVSSSIDRGVPMAERLLLGLQTTLLGLGTVFSVLIILMCVLFLFRLFFYSIPNRRNKNKNVVDSSVNDDSEATVPLVSASDNNGEVAAAIAAAVSLYLEAESAENCMDEKTSFRVVNFRRR